MILDKITFGDLYKIPSRNGVSKPSRVRGSGYKMVNMGELFKYDRITSIDMEKVPLTQSELERTLLEKNDLLFARQSIVASGAGKCSIMLDVTEKITFESHLIRVRLDESKCNPLYYYYYFHSNISGMSSIVSQCAQAGIKGRDLEKLEVIYPKLEVQNRIVKILSAYDDLIENNLKRIKLLEESAELIYKEWFVNFRFPGYEKCEVIDGVPSGWSKTKVGDYISFIKGKKPKNITEISNENSVLYLLVDVLEGNSFLYTEDKKVPVAMENEVIMIMDGSRSGTIYKSADGAIGSTMSIIRIVDNHLHDEYLYYYLKLNEIHIKKNNTGSAIPHANKEFIKDMDILIPTQYVMEKFSEYTRNISKQISVLKLQINKLKEARDILIPKLVMGEIEV